MAIFRFLLTISTILVIIFFLMINFVFTKPAEGEQPVKVLYNDWGIVSSIDNCRESKHSLRCKVVTDKYTFKSMDITDFPNNTLKEGDHIQSKTVVFQKSYKSYLVSNNLQLISGLCYSWMSCFNDYEQYVE